MQSNSSSSEIARALLRVLRVLVQLRFNDVLGFTSRQSSIHNLGLYAAAANCSMARAAPFETLSLAYTGEASYSSLQVGMSKD